MTVMNLENASTEKEENVSEEHVAGAVPFSRSGVTWRFRGLSDRALPKKGTVYQDS